MQNKKIKIENKNKTKEDKTKKQIKKISYDIFFHFGGATQNRTEDMSFADSCLTTWPWRHEFRAKKWSGKRGSNP